MSNQNNCKNRREEIAALVLGELQTDAAEQIKKHIDTCTNCRDFYKSMTDEEDNIRAAFDAIAAGSESKTDGLIKQLADSDKDVSAGAERQGRSIALKQITRVAAAVVVLAGLFLYTWLGRNIDTEPLNFITLLSRASAAEQSLFSGDGIVHIVNEIIVYPAAEDTVANDRLDELNLSAKHREYIEKSNSWLDYNWLPLCSLGADGQFRYNQLKLATDTPEPYTITDQAWYDPATGRFARLMQSDDKVVFANSYDGDFVYFSQTDTDGSLQLVKQPISEKFTSPEDPAAFLGLSAGLKSTLKEEDARQIQEVIEETLEDGSAVLTYKIGFEDLFGDVNTYWLFRVRADDSTIAEMEFVINESTQLVMRRVLAESTDEVGTWWDLSEIDLKTDVKEESPDVKVAANMVIPNVSVKHMAERATFETYVFAANPPWTTEREITDCIDPPSPGHRMFLIAHRADDGRHVVLVQAQTYNNMLKKFIGSGEPLYTSPNGFKVWSGGSAEKWWTNIILTSASYSIKDAPADDRVGYALESPAGTIPCLAINGPISDQELRSLVDSLVPAKVYQPIQGDPDE